MRPGLKKQIVRNASDYKLARHLVDGFALAQMLAAMILSIWICAGQFQQPEPNKLMVVGAVCGALAALAAAMLQREFLHGVFDIADCALTQRNIHGEEQA